MHFGEQDLRYFENQVPNRNKGKVKIKFDGVDFGEAKDFLMEPEREKRIWTLWWWDKYTLKWIDAEWLGSEPPFKFAVLEARQFTIKDYLPDQSVEPIESVRLELPIVHKHYQSATAYYKDYNDSHSNQKTA